VKSIVVRLACVLAVHPQEDRQYGSASPQEIVMAWL
jgi:hypothetical protein